MSGRTFDGLMILAVTLWGIAGVLIGSVVNGGRL